MNAGVLSEVSTADRAKALALTPVSRETASVLDVYIALLLKRQSRFNLIAPSTIPTVWTRHVSDSLQLVRWAPRDAAFVDLGSGAGFPGLVLACARISEHGPPVHLIESVGKKAMFLDEAARATGASVVVHRARIEDVAPALANPEVVVTARALAPLPRLLELAAPFFQAGGRGLFLKGKNAEVELTTARESWMLDCDVHPSVTDPEGRILAVHRAERRRN